MGVGTVNVYLTRLPCTVLKALAQTSSESAHSLTRSRRERERKTIGWFLDEIMVVLVIYIKSNSNYFVFTQFPLKFVALMVVDGTRLIGGSVHACTLMRVQFVVFNFMVIIQRHAWIGAYRLVWGL